MKYKTRREAMELRRSRMSPRQRSYPSLWDWSKGDPAQRQVAFEFRILLNSKLWRRHSEPFNKSERGRQRRAERRFARLQIEHPDFFLIQEEKLAVMDAMKRDGWQL